MGYCLKWKTEEDFRKSVVSYLTQCQIDRYEKLGQKGGAQNLEQVQTRNGGDSTLYYELPTLSGLALYTDTARSILYKYFKKYPRVFDEFNDYRIRAAVTNLTQRETASGAQVYISRYLIPEDEREAESELRQIRVKKARLELEIEKLKKKLLEKELSGTQSEEELTALKKLLDVMR